MENSDNNNSNGECADRSSTPSLQQQQPPPSLLSKNALKKIMKKAAIAKKKMTTKKFLAVTAGSADEGEGEGGKGGQLVAAAAAAAAAAAEMQPTPNNNKPMLMHNMHRHSLSAEKKKEKLKSSSAELSSNSCCDEHCAKDMAAGNDTAEGAEERGGGAGGGVGDFGYNRNLRNDEGEGQPTIMLLDEPTPTCASLTSSDNNNNYERNVSQHGDDNDNNNTRNFDHDDDDDDDDENNDKQEDNVDHLPSYLSPLVQHYRSEFYVSRSFDPQLIVQLMAEGFLPIATNGGMYLLPKLHAHRCVVHLNSAPPPPPHDTVTSATTTTTNLQQQPQQQQIHKSIDNIDSSSSSSTLHISRSIRRKSKLFDISINACFDDVVAGCHRHHGINWLYPTIVAAFRTIHEQTRGHNNYIIDPHPQQQQKHFQQKQKQQCRQHQQQQSLTSSTLDVTAFASSNTVGQGIPAMIINDDYSNSNSLPRSSSNSNSNNNKSKSKNNCNHTTRHISDMTPVRLYSIEIWNVKSGQLVGGELGYSVGGIYSSLTGYSDEESAGSVQLTALGCLLTRCGFEYWDLGMDLDYKRRLGAQLMPRDEFVANVKRTREENKGVIIQLVAACSSSSSDDCDGVQKQNAREIIDWKKKKV